MNTPDQTQYASATSTTIIPKKGGIHYWLLIAIMGLIVFLGTTTLIILVLTFLPDYALWVSLVVGVLMTTLFIRRKHRQLSSMSSQEYREYCLKHFSATDSQIDRNLAYYHEMTNIESPFNPSSSQYWATGPGSYEYQRKRDWD